jgi:hypothetical protein
MVPASFLTSQLCRPAALIQLHTLSCAMLMIIMILTIVIIAPRGDTGDHPFALSSGMLELWYSTMAMCFLRIRAIMVACRGSAAKGAAIPLSSYTSLSYHYTSYSTYEELYHRCVIAYRRRSVSHFAIVLSVPRFVSGESSPVPLFRAIG